MSSEKSKEEYKMLGYMLKGMLAEAPADERAKVDKAMGEIRATIDTHGDAAKVAVAIVLSDLMGEGWGQ